jgi:D-serine dehydratase
MSSLSDALARVPQSVRRGEPTVWTNPHRRPASEVMDGLEVSAADVSEARRLWSRAAPLLARLFPELEVTAGRIDSDVVPVPPTIAAQLGTRATVLVKTDHALPVTGCIKARGGIFEVLWYAFEVARSLGFDGDDTTVLASTEWKARFADFTVLVGSTGNLGFSVGLAARALGFAAEVHMSADAKLWKKERLRRLGVRVVEHEGDYTTAVAAARAEAASTPRSHFVDDESSRHLFVGYAAAAADLAQQLREAGIVVDATHPMQVYLPCGVGGAPGGVTLGLKQVWGDAVRCVFVEPVQSPSMLVQLAAGLGNPISVYDAGLTNDTVADGLACASASVLSARIMAPLLEGVTTVSDAAMLEWVRRLWADNGMRLEPSAAAAFEACAMAAGAARSEQVATHLIWTTGGALLPDDVFASLLQ